MKKFSTDDLVGMKINQADALASKNGYATAWFKKGEKTDISEANPHSQYLILIHDSKKVLSVQEWVK